MVLDHPPGEPDYRRSYVWSPGRSCPVHLSSDSAMSSRDRSSSHRPPRNPQTSPRAQAPVAEAAGRGRRAAFRRHLRTNGRPRRPSDGAFAFDDPGGDPLAMFLGSTGPLQQESPSQDFTGSGKSGTMARRARWLAGSDAAVGCGPRSVRLCHDDAPAPGISVSNWEAPYRNQLGRVAYGLPVRAASGRPVGSYMLATLWARRTGCAQP